MTDMDAFDRLIAREVLHASAPPRPVDDAAIFNAITTHSAKWRFQPMFSAAKFVVAGVIVALFGGFLLSGVLTTQRTEEPLPVGASVSPETSPIVTDVIDVGGLLFDHIVAAGDAVWVAGGTSTEGNLSRGSVSRIDPVTRQVTDTIAVGSDPSSMVPTEDALWVLNHDGKFSRIDLATRAVTEPIDGVFLSGGSYAERVDPVIIDGSLWAQSGVGTSASLVEVDLASQEIINEYEWPWIWHGADWMTEIDGAIWAWRKWKSRGDKRETLARFDLGTREFTFELDMDNKDLRGGPVASGDAIWSKNRQSRGVERFDVSSLAVTDTVELGPDEDLLDGVIAAEGSMWIRQGAYVYRFDTDTREVGDVIRVGDGRGQSTYADGAMWETDEGSRHTRTGLCGP